MSHRILAALPLLAFFWPLVVQAGPPFLTDDPDPVPYQSFEAIPFMALDRGQNSNVVQGEYLEGPGMDLNYGLHPEMHLNFHFGFAHAMPAMGAPTFGVEDTLVALKWRFIPEGDDHPSFAIYPAIVVPTGNVHRDLGNGQVSYNFPLWMEKSWSDWSSYGGVAYSLNRAPGARDHFYGGWQLQRNYGDSFLGGEIFSQGSSQVGDSGFTVLDLGGGYPFSKNAIVIGTVGHSIAGGSHALAYLGLDCTWGP